ncbi:MAG: RNA degradosome polyphosphate kinase, partial [Candidatus Latescibacterota bacterium]
SRIFSFENGGTPEVLIGSADWMPRNLRRRVEILCPVEDPKLIQHIRSEILSICIADNVKARELLPDGSHQRITIPAGIPKVSSQDILMKLANGEQIEIPDFFAIPPAIHKPTPAETTPASANAAD